MSATNRDATFDTGLMPNDLQRPTPVETPWGSFALFRLDATTAEPVGFVAVQSFCPHLDGPLFQGTRTGDEIVCPWHRWRFALRTGKLLEAEADAPEDPPGPQHDLAVCDVELSSSGTLVLRRPRPRS